MRRSSDWIRTAFALALWACCCASAAAQQALICEKTQTPDECSNRIRDLMQGKVATATSPERATATAQATEAKFNTGPSSAVDAAGAATTNDYVPFLQALLGTNPASGQDSDHLAVELSNFLPLPPTLQYKVTVQLLGSELFEPLDQALKAAGHSEERDDLKGTIRAKDDASITFSVSPAANSYSRNPDNFGSFFGLLLSRAVGPASDHDVKARAFDDALLGVIRANAAFRPSELEKSQVGFSALPDDDEDRLMRLFELKEQASHADLANIRENLRATGFYTALELLSNNPQFNLLANYRGRDETTGPDEWSVSLTYEHGWPSLRGARRELGCSTDTCLADKLGDYLALKSTRRMRNAAPRVAFDLTYKQRSRYEFGIESLAFAYAQASAKSLVGSVSYGQFVTGESGDAKRMRMDLTASYEDVSGDPAKNNRGVANLTFSIPVNDGLFLTLGAVYATKPEYRGEVDEDLGALAGLVYKFTTAE